MRIAITGGTGFVGSHLLRRLREDDHEVVVLARGSDGRTADLLDRSNARFVAGSVTDREALSGAFDGCDAVAHLAGINYERGDQSYETVHVAGTRAVVEAAEAAGVSRVVLTSYLRARPTCGSGYLESKWAAEEIVRDSDLGGTVVKPGIVYGPGDRTVRGIARGLVTAPVFPLVGLRTRYLRPLAIDDLVDVLAAATTDDRLSGRTVAVVGPEELSFDDLVRRVGSVIAREPWTVPTPVLAHRLGARVQELVMETPVVPRAGVRMLAEGATEPAPPGVCDRLPEDLRPTRGVTTERIEAALPRLEPFGPGDLRIGALDRRLGVFRS